MHFVPSHDFICLPQRGVNQTCLRRLQVSNLFSNEPAHEHKTELGRAVDIESIFANDCCQKRVLSTLIDTEGHGAGVVAERSVRLE